MPVHPEFETRYLRTVGGSVEYFVNQQVTFQREKRNMTPRFAISDTVETMIRHLGIVAAEQNLNLHDFEIIKVRLFGISPAGVIFDNAYKTAKGL